LCNRTRKIELSFLSNLGSSTAKDVKMRQTKWQKRNELQRVFQEKKHLKKIACVFAYFSSYRNTSTWQKDVTKKQNQKMTRSSPNYI
jgi:hypothetical protein